MKRILRMEIYHICKGKYSARKLRMHVKLDTCYSVIHNGDWKHEKGLWKLPSTPFSDTNQLGSNVVRLG
jgi:hypothetical protein